MYLDRLEKLNERQCVQFSIFCAELWVPGFEKEHPDDSRARKSIEAAKKWLENPRGTTADAVVTFGITTVTAGIVGIAVYAIVTTLYSTVIAAIIAFLAVVIVVRVDSDTPTNKYCAIHAADVAYTAVTSGADIASIENYLTELEKCTKSDCQN